VAKAPSPLVGFNNNVKHQGRIFHVQTEDSGVSRPHIVTHLFADGGRIIKSTRTDYSEHLGRSDMAAIVRRMMKEQHKAMFIALRDGQLDELVVPAAEAAAAAPAAAEPEPPPEAAPVVARRSSRPPVPRRQGPSQTLPVGTGIQAEPAPPLSAEPVAASGTLLVPRRPAPTLTDLVLADLEAARLRDAPPEPVAAVGRPVPRGGTPVLGTPASTSRPAVSGRYAKSRPAAIFTNAPDQASNFGGSSISEQSLDEVILSYLAEDLDGAAGEK
jgi:hypothetical protein